MSKERENFYFSGIHFLTIAVDWVSSNIRVSIWYGSIYGYLRNKYLLVEFNYILMRGNAGMMTTGVQLMTSLKPKLMELLNRIYSHLIYCFSIP